MLRSREHLSPLAPWAVTSILAAARAVELDWSEALLFKPALVPRYPARSGWQGASLTLQSLDHSKIQSAQR
eukprot:9377180-Alexandrium_andersonii.AAC.1